MSGGNKLIDQIAMTLRGTDSELTVWIDVLDNSLSGKWLKALNDLLTNRLHLEKNYCWLGWPNTARSVDLLCNLVNRSVDHINRSGLNYNIDTEPFAPDNVIQSNLDVNHERTNQLHRWFEDLQGWSGGISQHYHQADAETRWHIRQLNLLCHELECLILSMRKAVQAPEWQRPSQLMCWLRAPRFQLDDQDLELFGIETINRNLGGVYVGVNKAVGKHHWEVFNDEGRDSRITELVTSSLRSQTEAAGDFDIEWARDPGSFPWQIRQLKEFRQWLTANGFDPDDKQLTIGHPKVAQVDLLRSFGTEDYQQIWAQLRCHLDVYKIQTSTANATYNYRWDDPDYMQQQLRALQ